MQTLDALPFDIFFEISRFLNVDDITHVRQTCSQLRRLLGDDGLARQAVEANHAYSEEARQAREGTISYREAFVAIYDRRHAFSNAQPFSASVVGQGSSFLYRQGVLCVLKHSIVSIRDLRSRTLAYEIHLRRFFKSENAYQPGDSYRLLHYNDGILAVHVANRQDETSFVMFVNAKDNLNDSQRGMGLLAVGLPDSKLFVRHTSQYVCCGTHTGQGSDGHRKWVIQTYKMESVQADIELDSDERNSMILEDFHGDDVGSTVAFEIHEDYLYAVSNQSTYEVAEVDWTSFYHCLRIPLDNPTGEATDSNPRVYRRQHRDGAIHDLWTDLTLQRDERTNDLYIVESRREWVGSTSRHERAFYTSRIEFGEAAAMEEDEVIDCSSDQVTPLPLPENDPLATTLPSSHRANYMPTPKQYSWTRHPEFAHTGGEVSNPLSFMLARTKFRAYNSSCSAFVDLVEDDKCCPDRLPSELPCLRLRIGSRRFAPDVGSRDAAAAPNDRHLPQFEDNTQYRYTPIRMWPPARTDCPCSQRIHCIINPDTRANLGIGSDKKTITAVCDERSIVYMVKPSRSYQDRESKVDHRVGTIVLVDFGRPPPSSSLGLYKGDWQSEWVLDQHKCKKGKC